MRVTTLEPRLGNVATDQGGSMCVVSMIHDHFEPVVPWVEPYPIDTTGWPPHPPTAKPFAFSKSSEVAAALDLAALLKEFRDLIEAAKLIDIKTKQPDCVDPEKVKLQDRVAELEKLIAQPPEFVIVSGGQIEPGRYRVIGGKLYRAVE